jgi:RNA polymerase sigma-70 factor (ECF subfamily)
VREQPTDELEAPDSSPGADVLLEADERRRFLHAAIAQLDDERRAVLVLYDLDGVAMKDIADALSIPLFTAYSRLRAAREDLAAHVHRMRLRQGAKL